MKVAALILAATLALSCGGGAAEPVNTNPGCANDTDCPSALACVAGSCVSPRPLSSQWMLEITPLTEVTPPADIMPSRSIPAPTEFASIVPGNPADIPTFTVDAQATVSVTVTYAATAAAPATAHVLLSIPSEIPGRPDLTLEVPALPDTTKLDAVPSLKIGRPATVSIAPLSGDDSARVPPRSFPVTLAASLAIDVQSDLSIRGKILDPFNSPLPDAFVARAFQQGNAVSNGPTVDALDGSFTLLVPASVAATPFVIDLEPQNAAGPNPWFRSNPMQLSASVTLPTINMPPYLKTGNQFSVTVQGEVGGMPGVPGALVRALTDIPQSNPTQTDLGLARFLQNVMTGDGGAATTTLVPGTANANQIYEIATIPPVGSPYATTCLSQQPVGPGSTPPLPPANLPTILLLRRPVFSGKLVDGKTGAPLPNTIVTATPTADPLPSCPMTMTRASSGTTLTGTDGHFELPLDPGTYQLDYDPPAGSAVPRLSERVPFAIAADVTRTVSLPAAAVIEGKVFRPDSKTPLPGATVRIFEPRCASSVGCVTPPWLIAQTQSDAHGLFRAVVPSPN